MADFAPAPMPQPAGLTPLPTAATPEAFGAGVAQAGEQAAAGVQQHELQANQILLNNRYDADLLAAQVARAQAHTQVAAAIDGIQRDPNLNLADYQNRVGQAVDTILTPITQNIANTKIARQMNAQVAEDSAGYATQADDWQTMQIAGQVMGRAGVLKNALDGQAAQAPTLDALHPIAQQWADSIHGLAGLTPDQRSNLAISGIQDFPAVWARTNANSPDPARLAAVSDALQSGALSQAGVKGDQLAMIERTVNSRTAHFAAQATAQQEAAQAQFMVAGRQLAALPDHGASAPLDQYLTTEAQARQMYAASVAAGKPKPELSELADSLHLAGVKVDVNGTYASQPPAQVALLAQNAQAAIAAKQAQGQTVSLDEGAHATALAALASQMNSQLQSDPTSLAAARGIALAPLNPGDPTSFARRADQMHQVGLMVQSPVPLAPLTGDETKAFAKQVAQPGDAGRMAVLGQLDNFDPVTRAMAARQIAPSDGTLVAEAQIDPGNRALVATGRDLLSKNSGFWNTKPAGSQEPPPAKTQWTAVGAQINDALRLISPTDRAGIAQTAQNWLAGMYATQGRADSMGITPQDTDAALRVALGGGYHRDPATGAEVATGGIGHWGSTQSAYVVPEKMTGSQFQGAVYNQVQADRAKGGGPVQGDGKSPFDLKFATPVLTGGSTYMFRAGQNYVKAPNGQPYVLKLGQ